MMKWQNFGRTGVLRRASPKNSALPGGRSLRARAPLYGSMWLVETVLSQAILFFTGGVEAVKMTNRKSGKKITFCLIALDPGNRLRYPPVSLFFAIYWWSWLRRGFWDNLFDIEICGLKVGL